MRLALTISLVLLGFSIANADPNSLTSYQFNGQFAARKVVTNDAVKRFELTIIPRRAGEESRSFWILQEKGRGSFAWTDHVGELNLDALGRIGEARPIAMLFEREEGKSIVPIPIPLAGLECPLSEKGSWSDGKLEFNVVGSESIGNQRVVRVDGRNAYGVRRRLWIQPETRVIHRLLETVFVGQGEEYELAIEFAGVREIADTTEVDDVIKGFDALLALRDKINRPPNSLETNWSTEQLAVLRERKGQLSAWQRNPLLGPVVEAIEQESKSLRDRAGAIASLREKAIGRELSLFGLTDAQGKEVARERLAGRVIVLHFWDYKDMPLVEPYGQVGYVDFLWRKQREADVRVYGVAVDGRWADESSRRSVSGAANRLVNFMNLSYPILFDDGSVLKQIGDPRPAGSPLPLFVVIGKEGKIIEYHAGAYEVTRDLGIEQLNRIVTKAVSGRE